MNIHELKDRAINLCRRAATPAARLLVQSILFHLDANEPGTRRRPRTKASRENFERLVESIVCDATYQVLFQRTVKLHVSRDATTKRSRYRLAWDSGTVRPSVLDRLHELGFIIQHKAAPLIHRMPGCLHFETTIEAGDDLVVLALVYGVRSIHDFVLDTSTQELMLLKSKKFTEVLEAGKQIQRPSELIEYEDHRESLRQRDEIRRVNLCLSSFPMVVMSTEETPIDPREVHVRGYYTCGDPTFQQGGRFFNRPLPFYMSLSKEHRPVVIQKMGTSWGTGVAEVDYNAMNPRLLYALAEVGLPAAMQVDPYLVPGFERSRAGIKKVFNAMLFGEDLPAWTMYPDNMVEEGLIGPLFHQEEYRPIQKVMDAIRAAHVPVAHLFGTGIGHRLMNLEAGLLRLIILRTFAKGIPCLPVHDCLIVPSSQRRIVARVMIQAFRDFTGIEGRVKIEQKSKVA